MTLGDFLLGSGLICLALGFPMLAGWLVAEILAEISN